MIYSEYDLLTFSWQGVSRAYSESVFYQPQVTSTAVVTDNSRPTRGRLKWREIVPLCESAVHYPRLWITGHAPSVRDDGGGGGH